MDIATIRSELKSDFDQKAEWRRQKAAEYPHDARNLKAAAVYDRFAGTVALVPDALLIAYRESFEDEAEVLLHEELMRRVFYGGCPQSATEFCATFVSRIHLGVEPA